MEGQPVIGGVAVVAVAAVISTLPIRLKILEMDPTDSAARADLGDAATGMEGANCRPIGKVDNPSPLTEYREDHPYIVAMYDVKDAG